MQRLDISLDQMRPFSAFSLSENEDGSFALLFADEVCLELLGIGRDRIQNAFSDKTENGFAEQLYRCTQRCLSVASRTFEQISFISNSGQKKMWAAFVPIYIQNNTLEQVQGMLFDSPNIENGSFLELPNERKFHDMIENSRDIIVRYDKQGKRIYENQAYLTHVGRTFPREPDQRPRTGHLRVYWETVDKVLVEGKPATVNFTVQAGDGTERAYSFQIEPEFDSLGNLDGALSIGRDLSEEKQRNDKIVKDLHMVRTLLNNLPQSIILFDNERKCVFANKTANNFFEETKSAIGKHLEDFGPYEDPRVINELASLIARAFRESVPNNTTVRLKTKLGNRVFSIDHVPEIDSQGKIGHVIGIARDITDYIEISDEIDAKKRLLDEFFQSEISGIFHCDLNGVLVRANRCFCEMSGFITEELAHMQLKDLFLYFENITLTTDFFGNEKKSNRIETKLRRKNKSLLDVELFLDPLESEKGRVISFCTDISERKHKTELLELMYFAINQITESVFLADSKFRISMVNDEACRSLGFSRELLLSMDISVFAVGWKDIELLKLARQLKQEKSITIETRQKTANGRIIPVEIVVTYFNYSSQNYILGLVRDLTDRKRGEEIKRLVVMANTISDELITLLSKYEEKETRAPTMKKMGFTDKQIQIAKRVLEGEPTKIIATSLGISESTVKTNLTKIYRLLDVGSRMEFSKKIIEQNILLE